MSPARRRPTLSAFLAPRALAITCMSLSAGESASCPLVPFAAALSCLAGKSCPYSASSGPCRSSMVPDALDIALPRHGEEALLVVHLDAQLGVLAPLTRH